MSTRIRLQCLIISSRVLLLLLVTLLLHVTSSPACAHPDYQPGRKHAVSRSSFHTSRGRVRDTSRWYPGQGTSHLRYAHLPNHPPEGTAGRHMWEPDVYKQMVELAQRTWNDSSMLPSIRAAESGVPEQIKISLTARSGEVVFNWLTWNETQSSTLLGDSSGKYTKYCNGSSHTFIDPNDLHLIRYIHNCVIDGLEPLKRYYYMVGDPTTNVWSEERSFRMIGQGNEKMRVAVYGDLGLVNSISMKYLADEVKKETIDLVLHVGDFAYDLDDNQGMTGDMFMNEMQDITAQSLYMGCVGNHEGAHNFSHFLHRFSNWNYINDPKGGDDKNLYFSWDMMSGGAKVHFLAIDSELYYQYAKEPQPPMERVAAQWHWLRDDLERATKSGDYAFIIAYAHRPMYCSNVDDMPDCSTDAGTLRKGFDHRYGIETLMHDFNVDLFIAAHEHSYERTWPVYNGTIDKSQEAHPNLYHNPKYTTHIVSGSGGCQEYFDYYDDVFYGPWSVVRSSTYGYGHLTIHNETHLHWEQLLDEGHGGTDELWIVKDKEFKQQQRQQMMKRMKMQDDKQLHQPLFPNTQRVALE